MKCPSCKNPLREKGAGGMTLDVCYGGCGGIWFDATELERVSASAATTLHTIWNVPISDVKLTEPRLCPRCPELILERKWFSDLKKVEIDQCAKCGGIWLDAGRIHPYLRRDQGRQDHPAPLGLGHGDAVACVQAN